MHAADRDQQSAAGTSTTAGRPIPDESPVPVVASAPPVAEVHMLLVGAHHDPHGVLGAHQCVGNRAVAPRGAT